MAPKRPNVKQLLAPLKARAVVALAWLRGAKSERQKRRTLVWLAFAIISSTVAYAYASLLFDRLSQDGTQAVEYAKRIVIDVPSGTVLFQDAVPVEEAPQRAEPVAPVEPESAAPEVAVETDPFVEDIAKSLEVELPAEPEPTAEPANVLANKIAKALAEADEVAAAAADAATTILPDDQAAIEAQVDAAGESHDSTPELPVLPTITNTKFKGKIAIIVTEMGLRRNHTLQALGLPEEVTFAFSPYAPDLLYLTTKMKEKNRPYLLELPFDDADYPYSDPGPYGITGDGTLQQNMYRLQKLMELGAETEGFFAAPDEVFTNEVENAIPVLDSLRRSGKMLVLDARDENQEVRDQAFSSGLPHVAGYMQLDDVPTKAAMYQKMADARTHINEGFEDLVLVTRSYPQSIALVNDFVTELLQAGYTIHSPFDMVVR